MSVRAWRREIARVGAAKLSGGSFCHVWRQGGVVFKLDNGSVGCYNRPWIYRELIGRTGPFADVLHVETWREWTFVVQVYVEPCRRHAGFDELAYWNPDNPRRPPGRFTDSTGQHWVQTDGHAGNASGDHRLWIDLGGLMAVDPDSTEQGFIIDS